MVVLVVQSIKQTSTSCGQTVHRITHRFPFKSFPITKYGVTIRLHPPVKTPTETKSPHYSNQSNRSLYRHFGDKQDVSHIPIILQHLLLMVELGIRTKIGGEVGSSSSLRIQSRIVCPHDRGYLASCMSRLIRVCLRSGRFPVCTN